MNHLVNKNYKRVVLKTLAELLTDGWQNRNVFGQSLLVKEINGVEEAISNALFDVLGTKIEGDVVYSFPEDAYKVESELKIKSVGEVELNNGTKVYLTFYSDGSLHQTYKDRRMYFTTKELYLLKELLGVS